MTLSASQKARRKSQQAQKRKAMVASSVPVPKKGKKKQNGGAKKKKQQSGKDTYLDHLMYPEVYAGVRIPDSTSFVPTVTERLVTRISVAPVQNSSDQSYGAMVFTHTTTTAAVGTVTTMSNSANFGIQYSPLSGWNLFIARCSAYRVVSACMIVEYTGRMDASQGSLALWQTYDSTTPPTIASVINDANVIIKPARSSFSKICFRPRDNSDFEFVPTNDTSDRQHFGFLAYGVDATFSANVTIIYNLEGIPIWGHENTLGTNPTVHNPSQMSQAAGYLSTITTMVVPAMLGVGIKAARSLTRPAQSRVEPVIYEL